MNLGSLLNVGVNTMFSYLNMILKHNSNSSIPTNMHTLTFALQWGMDSLNFLNSYTCVCTYGGMDFIGVCCTFVFSFSGLHLVMT